MSWAAIFFAAGVPLILLLAMLEVFHPHRRRRHFRSHRGQLARYIPGYYPLMRESSRKKTESGPEPSVEPDDSAKKPRIHEGLEALESIKRGMFWDFLSTIIQAPFLALVGLGVVIFCWWVVLFVVVPFFKAL